MPITELLFNENDQEHVRIADDLGLLQRNIDKNVKTDHEKYVGHELSNAGVNLNGGNYYRKKDVAGGAGAKGDRTKNRVIIEVDKSNKVVENSAYYWRHDGRVNKLSKGFFERAQRMRKI